ncbi:MAG: hypothetical protein GXN97_02560 [Aquificae bacterium]|nr:hypothetical protein [Aquificota bacterium]
MASLKLLKLLVLLLTIFSPWFIVLYILISAFEKTYKEPQGDVIRTFLRNTLIASVPWIIAYGLYLAVVHYLNHYLGTNIGNPQELINQLLNQLQ